MKKFYLLAALMAISTSLLGSEEIKTNKLEETVITSENSNETLGSINKNITIITSEEIAEKGAQSVADALKTVSDVIVKEMTGSEPVFDIRGQGTTAISNVLVLLDGIPLNSIDMSGPKTSQIPINTVERIEVIPSGGAVLYGDGAIGGVINIITKKVADRENYGNLSLTFGSYNLRQENVSYGTKIGDKLLFDMGYINKKKDGYRDYQKDKLESFYLKTRYLLDNGSIGAHYTYLKTKFKTPGALNYKEVNQNRKQSNPKTWRIDGNTEKNRFSGDYIYNLTEKLEFKMLGDFSKESYNSTSSSGPYNYKTDILYLKPQIKYSYLDNGYLVVGGDYYKGKTKIEKTDTIKKDSLGGYLINNITFDKFNFIQGYRYQKIKYSNNLSSLHLNKKFNEQAFDLSTSYKYSDSGKVYISYSKAFRTPNTDELAWWYPENNFKPQKTNTYELGIKDAFKNIILNGSVFYIDTKDEIYYNQEKNTNLDGKSKRKGIDLSIEEYFGKLRLSQGITYIHSKFKQGKAIPGIPKIKGVFNINYQMTEQININNSYEYFGKAYKNDDLLNVDKKVDDYLLVGINLQYKINNSFIIEGGVKNLFNEKYYDFVKYPNSYYPAPERNYYGKITYTF